MKLNLAFVGTTDNARENLARFLKSHDVTASFHDEFEELSDVILDAPLFLAVPFHIPEEFRSVRSRFRQSFGRDRVIAILASTDYHTCAEAFRMGASDVLLSPYTSKELERLIVSMNALIDNIIHPDAITSLQNVEKIAISEAILACSGQVSRTSRKLGIGRSTLYRKMEQYGLYEPRDRDQG